MTETHPDVRAIDRAIAEHDVRQLAEELGYSTAVLTDGTIVCEPRPDPEHCGICAYAADLHDGRHGPDGDHCAECGCPLDVLNRHQIVVQDPNGGLGFTLRFVCRQHYVDRIR
jgi:hypothetical protein